MIVSVAVPVAAVALAVNVRVEVLVAGFALNPAVTPLGRPEAERVTLPSNPFAGATVMVLVVWPACVTLTVFGLAERV